ncbi:MAG: hypothetical protein FD180_3276 [Planctomycetota bacterium]|nr:MAG: hypothetical protein FD180_3276 [Planctomycetota bacterium]
MIDSGTFGVGGAGNEDPLVIYPSRERAPAGLRLELIVLNLQDDRLFVSVQQSPDRKRWEILGLREICCVGWEAQDLYPASGRLLRLMLWTQRRRLALVRFRIFDNGRSASA